VKDRELKVTHEGEVMLTTAVEWSGLTASDN
jgi:hypothetical protein